MLAFMGLGTFELIIVGFILLCLIGLLFSLSTRPELSCPKCDALTRRGGRPAWQIVVAILLFPIGLLALLAGRKPTVCEKCGYRWMA
jgi:hypothetical protein